MLNRIVQETKIDINTTIKYDGGTFLEVSSTTQKSQKLAIKNLCDAIWVKRDTTVVRDGKYACTIYTHRREF